MQSVLIELLGRDIRCGDERDAAAKQRINESSENHGVANIADKKLVKTHYQCLVGNVLCDDFERILGATVTGQTRVDPLHEAVKMHAQFALEGQAVKKGIDQMCLASTYATPDIEASLGLAGSPELATRPCPEPLITLCSGDQSRGEIVQLQDNAGLRGVLQQHAGVHVTLVALKR